MAGDAVTPVNTMTVFFPKNDDGNSQSEQQ